MKISLHRNEIPRFLDVYFKYLDVYFMLISSANARKFWYMTTAAEHRLKMSFHLQCTLTLPYLLEQSIAEKRSNTSPRSLLL